MTFRESHRENVLFSRIKIPHGVLHPTSGGYVPQPRHTGGHIELVKHRDGMYTIFDGAKRLYWLFVELIDHRNGKWPEDEEIECVVDDEISEEPSRGIFVWQVTRLKTIRRSTFDRVYGWIRRKSRFLIVNEVGRFFLSPRTLRVLAEAEDLLASLYSDSKTRLYDLRAIVKIEKYAEQSMTDEHVKDQLERLKRYEKRFQELVSKEFRKEGQEISLLEELVSRIEKDLERKPLSHKHVTRVRELLQLLKGNSADEVGILRSFKTQLEIIQSGRFPSDKAEIQRCVDAELAFMKKFRDWDE